MTSLVALLLAAAPAQVPDLRDHVTQDFRTGVFQETKLTRVGPRVEKFMQKDPEGLRITLPEGEHPGQYVGVGSKLFIHGDFDITASYQLLEVEVPDTGYGSGVSLWVMLETPQHPAATLGRIIHPKKGEVYSTDHAFTREQNERLHKDQRFPAVARAGKLRLVRTGKALHYYVAENLDSEFTLLRTEEDFGDAPVKHVRISADPGGAKTKLDVVLEDFTIRATELSPSLTITRNIGWVIWGVWGALGLAGVGLLAGSWAYWRRRGKGGEARVAPGRPVASGNRRP